MAYRWIKRPKNFPPGPRGVPILGVIPFIGSHIERTFRDWGKQYGPVMAVRLGRKDFVILNNLDVIKQALVKEGAKFSGRPRFPLMNEMTKGHGLAFVDYGEHWRAQSKFGHSTLRTLGMGRPAMERMICEEMEYMQTAIRNHNENPFDLLNTLRLAVSNNICNLTFGKRFDYNHVEFTEAITSITEFFTNPDDSVILRVVMFAPFLRKIPPFDRARKNTNEVNMKILKLAAASVREHEKVFDPDHPRDFIDAFLCEMNKNTPTFTKMQLIHYVRILFFAGTETTTAVLMWALLVFLHHPKIQKKVYEEVKQVVGDRQVSMSDQEKMPYTRAFLQEIHRYRTVAPNAIPHCTSEDADLNGFTIPKGTTVLPNLWAVHNNPDVWPEPEKFKPERHLSSSGNFIPSNHIVPFGVGLRRCLGELLARIELFLFLVGLVQKFEFLPDPTSSTLPDIEQGVLGIVYVPHRYKLVARER